MLYAAAGESVMVTDAATRDRDGNPVAASAPRQVDGVITQTQTTSTNTAEHGNVPVTLRTTLFPEDDPIALGATVTWPGRTGDGRWHVVGCPRLAQNNFSGRVFGLIVDLTKAGNGGA